MNTRRTFGIIFATLTVLALAFEAQAAPAANTPAPEWQLDNAHSEVGFSVRHLGISNVKGKFKDFSAKVTADPKTGMLSAVEGTVKIASIDTGIGQRDDHLRAPDFFDAAKFPEMTLKTKRITFKGTTLTGVADLTIKGVTKEVTFTGEHLGVQKANMGYGDQLRTGYSVSTTINRKDFGLGWNMMVEKTAVVSDQVKINLEIELQRPCAADSCA